METVPEDKRLYQMAYLEELEMYAFIPTKPIEDRRTAGNIFVQICSGCKFLEGCKPQMVVTKPEIVLVMGEGIGSEECTYTDAYINYEGKIAVSFVKDE